MPPSIENPGLITNYNTSPSVFIPYFDVHEKNEKNSFSFFFPFMQHLFLTYNTIELDNISLTSISNCFVLLVEGQNGNELQFENITKTLFCSGCLVIQLPLIHTPSGHTRVSADTISVSLKRNWLYV